MHPARGFFFKVAMSGSATTTSLPRRHAWLRLAGYALALWGFFGFVGPWIISAIPAWRQYCEVQDAHGLNSGAIFYTDVPVSQEAELANRAAVEAAMSRRRAAAQKETDL